MVAGMSTNALPAPAADAGDTGFGQSWHLVGVPASGRRRRHSWPGPGKDVRPGDRDHDVDDGQAGQEPGAQR